MRRQSKTKKAPETKAPETKARRPKAEQLIRYLGPVVVIGTIVTFVAVNAPFPYAASKATYSQANLASASMVGSMTEEARRKLEDRIGADFSGIFTPINEEHPPGMLRASSGCLPRGRLPGVTMPAQTLQAFGQATDYMACLMTKERMRFCDAAERARLVEKLLVYRDRLQNALATETAFAEAREANAEFSAQSPRIGFGMDAAAGGAPPDDAAPPAAARDEAPSVYAAIDPRIMRALAALRRDGLFSAADFGWYGLFAPAEYAPALKTAQARDLCG